MVPITRRFLAVLSVCDIAACVVAYIESFSEARVDTVFWWWIILIPGLMVLVAPMYALEYPASRRPLFLFREFLRGMPSWVGPCSWILMLVAWVHFGWFAAHSGAGVPAIIDGQYVLDLRGKILRVLTQEEYLKLRGEEIRMFTSITINMYFIPAVYWWYR